MPLAHFGHWYVSIIFAAPALLMMGALGVGALRERRRDRSRDGGRGGEQGPPGP